MIFLKISNYLIPAIVLWIIFYAFRKKVNLYDSFVAGAKEGMEMGFSIFPFLIGMIFGINVLLKSEILNVIFVYLKPIFDLLHIPIEILPMAVVRPISGNASFAVMIDIIKTHGVDSFLGRIASTLQGATDTTIYVLSLYFGSVGIKKIRYALKAGLFADMIALVMSVLLISLFFAS